MNVLDSRQGALGAGVILLIIGVGASALLKDSALSGIVALAGCALILYAILWDKLESFGPSGLKLRELKERAKQQYVGSATASDELPAISESVTATVSHGQAAALIDAAKTPEELVDALVALNAPETMGGRYERVRQDDKARETMGKYGKPTP